jgi:hypothetical protein
MESECEDCQKKSLQRRAATAAAPRGVPPIVHGVLHSPGQPLDRSTRAFMESRFGHDFSQVRIHSDGQAAASAAAVSALAYTAGHHIVFGADRYQPGNGEGRRLIGHELTHVVQQSVLAAPQGILDDPVAEAEAERNAEATAAAGPAAVHAKLGPPGLQRQPAPPQTSPTLPVATAGSGLDADDQKIVDAAQREAASFKCNVGPVLWGLLHKHFPDDGRKVAGTGCETALPGLRTEFAATDPKDPKVQRSVPMIYAGKVFVASTDAAHLKDRMADVAAEIAKIDDWRLASFLIDDKDLANPRITGQLRSFSNGQLIDYRNKTKDSEVKRYVENLVTFSTPTQAGAAVDPLSNNMTLPVGKVNVVIQPDVRGAAGSSGGDTAANLTLNPPSIPAFNIDPKGNVIDFPGYSPTATVTILTSYGAGVTPEGTSGYGRGTTAEDIRNKATALRVHEGSHGEDFINFVRQNPLPVFAGKNGDKATDFKTARQTFLDALSDWGKRLNRVKLQTDCVGKTIDQFHQGESGYKKICP